MPRGRAKTCADCPKRAENGCCLIYAKMMVARHPVCEYGKVAIRNERNKKAQRVRRGQTADGSQTKVYSTGRWKVKTNIKGKTR